MIINENKKIEKNIIINNIMCIIIYNVYKHFKFLK
jgi:hypothetical protein